MNLKFNSLYTGLILGISGPILALIIIYIIASDGLSLRDYMNQLVFLKVYTHIISLSAIPNLLTFFIFIWLNKLKSARGVLFATIILALFVLGLKLFT
ncbi:MAG: hypothetical protein JSV24_04915 [Bacteroidales bacterium]|nr:MAG: hypothetical protein JSV24_04915 [Bacteroidales bacterium]